MRYQTTSEWELTAGVPALLRLDTGEQVHIRLARAGGIVSLASFDAAEPLARLSMYTTQSMNHTWRLAAGHTIMDTECRVAWTIDQDADGALYAGGGYCGRLLDVAGRERRDLGETCGSVFATHLTPLGYGARHLGPDTFLTAFVRPEYHPDGGWNVAPAATVGHVLALTTAYPQQVAVLVCPHHPRSPQPAGGPAATLTTHAPRQEHTGGH